MPAKNEYIFDGSIIFSISRNENGVLIEILENDGTVFPGKVKITPFSAIEKYNVLIKMLLPNELTYINLVRALLAYADVAELNKILRLPIAGSAFSVVVRKKKK